MSCKIKKIINALNMKFKFALARCQLWLGKHFNFTKTIKHNGVVTSMLLNSFASKAPRIPMPRMEIFDDND